MRKYQTAVFPSPASDLAIMCDVPYDRILHRLRTMLPVTHCSVERVMWVTSIISAMTHGKAWIGRAERPHCAERIVRFTSGEYTACPASVACADCAGGMQCAACAACENCLN